MNPSTRTDGPAVLRQVFHPPAREWQFWAIQFLVTFIAGIHLVTDTRHTLLSDALPAGIPVALLIIPVGYAAIRYGLAGSAATSIWATLLWLPDIFVRHGHLTPDVIDLVLIDIVAFVFGQRIESERFARWRAERATEERRSAEASYRQLFESNRTPIVVLDASGQMMDANPAARRLFDVTNDLAVIRDVAAHGDSISTLNGRIVQMSDGQDYRVDSVELPSELTGATTQVIFEDVTAELGISRRATQYARLVVKVEEELRRELARELHDEPLQLFLHLARRLESLGSKDGVPEAVTGGLEVARHQALEAADRLRVLARDLRPPALDRLGLVPALSSLLSDVEEESELVTSLTVGGVPIRLHRDLELGAFRIIQESVRNAIKHAVAQRIKVTVEFEPSSLTISIHDDGLGFQPDLTSDSSVSGMGIMGMYERANLLGGELTVESSPGQGTTVHARFAIDETPPL